MAVTIGRGGAQSVGSGLQQRISPKRFRTISGGGGGDSRVNVPRDPTVQIQGSTVLINGQGFSVRPEDQASFIQQQTGGRGTSAQNAITLANIQRESILKQRAEQQRQAQAEKQRIENLKKEIQRQGAQQRQKILINQQGQRIRQTVTEVDKIERGKLTNVRVVEQVNLATGEKAIKTFERPTGGGGLMQSGGLVVQGQSPSEVKKIKEELTSSGLKPILKDGQVVGFSSPDTKQSYAYNEKGIEAFNKKMEVLNTQQGATKKPGRILSLAMKGDTAIGKGATTVKNIVSNSLRRSGINIKDSKVKNYISKVASQLKNKGIDKLKSFRKFSEKRREEAQINLRKFNFKKPSTYKEANRWLLNFDKYVTNKAIVTAIDLGIATPVLINQIRKNPLATIATLPGAIKQGFVQDFRTIKSGDPFKITDLAIDYFVYSATFGIASKGVKSTTRGIMQLLPGTKKLVGGKIIVRKASKFSKKPTLVLKSQTVKSGSKPLSAQARFAGKKVTAVTAQADQLTSLLRRKKIIRKPIPGEASFPTQIKKTLAKFDAGKRLSNKEFTKINSWLRKNVAPNTTLLERSLYLDPASGLRISRLGIQTQKTATLRDILRGNFTLWNKMNKPQILVFENAKIAKFPKALRIIERKLKTGKPLTTAETNKLIRWQVQTGSGKFKPIGSTIYAGGKELEITLAPGELIKRVKSLGRVYIDGRKVTIVSAEVFKPSKVIIKQMKLAQLGKLSKGAVNKLNNFLSKKLGRKVRVETPDVARSFAKKAGRMARRADPNIPVLRVRGSGIVVLRSGMRGLVARPSIRTPIRIGGRITSRVIRGGRVTGRTPTRTTGRAVRGGRFTRTPVKRTPERRVIAKRTTRPVKSSRRSRVVRGGRRGDATKKPPVPLRLEGFQQKRLPKSVPTYYVVEKVRGKFKKLYPKPLTQKDARDYAAYSIDNRLSKTAFFIPLSKSRNVVRPPKNIQGYFSKTSKKYRPYRIRFGKKRRLVNGFIEKRKFSFDKPGEKVTARRLKRATTIRREPRRKISVSQRRILLERLKKARAVRMKNLRKKRK